MTPREVYERSNGKPWEVKELLFDENLVSHNHPWWWYPTPVSAGISIPDSLAEAAMMRGMVEWLVNETFACTLEAGSDNLVHAIPGFHCKKVCLSDNILESLLLACEAVEGAKQ